MKNNAKDQNIRPRVMEIHIGDNTHNQDQLIVPVNFNTTKTIVNTVGRPKPALPLLAILYLSLSSDGRT